MANHSEDCPHCGKDQRNAGLACCETAKQERDAAIAKFRAVQVERRQLLERLGIRTRDRQSTLFSGEWEIVPDLPTLFAYLQTQPTPGL